MQQKRRHHYVPKAYLNAFRDQRGCVLVDRKDKPGKPLHVTPDATQFRRYYYSQPLPEGGTDNNVLEDLFAAVEGDWPETVSMLHKRQNMNSRLDNIFQFMSLQRVRVPASRDAVEAMLATTIKSTMRVMLATGQLPPPPKGFEDIADKVEVSIDPHRSILAMKNMLEGMGQLFSKVGLTAVHNATSRPFLTNDNPVMWVDPSLPFEQQAPYTIRPDGPIILFFPVSPALLLLGTSEYKENFGVHGLLHSDAPDEAWVDQVNAQTCRFGYEAVIAQGPGQEAMISEHTAVSPVHEAIPLPINRGEVTLHRYVFGPRSAKPKWNGE